MPVDLLAPAVELRGRLRAGEIRASELIEATLERIEQVNPTVNAIVTINPDALDEARAADRALERGTPGPLCGLPVGIKDTTPTAGLRTTYGSPLFAEHVPAEDAEVVRRLRQAGAVIVGKTNTPEFAVGGNTFNEVFGPTRNPWNPALTAGGSTGGGAAALASGMIALAEGSDLGGSLRMPASFCGVVGLRPSPGLVPLWPTPDPWDTLSVAGPMGRTAADIALFLDAVAGPLASSPLRQPAAGRDFAAAVATPTARGRRIAYVRDLAGIGIDPEIEAVCRDAAHAFAELGAAVSEIELDLSRGWQAFQVLRGVWMVTHHLERLDRLGELGANLRGNLESGLQWSAREIAEARRERAAVRRRVLAALADADVVLTPSMAVPPFPVEQSHPTHIGERELSSYVDWFAPTFLLSLTSLPVGSAPCGLDGGGNPVGLQIIGPPAGEELVLAVAACLEQLCPLGRPRGLRRQSC